MTPLQYQRAMEAHRADREDAQKRDVANAWRIADFVAEIWSTGKLRPLADVLGMLTSTPAEPKPLTAADITAQLSQFGIPMRPMSEEAQRAFVRVNGNG